MSGRTKRAMAPPPNQTGSAPSYHIGSAPASANQVPTPVPAFLGGGSTIPSTGGQATWWPGPLPQATSSGATSTVCGNKNAKKRLKDKTLINLDDGNDGRTAKRLVFESEEDVRLVSALLIHSNNPINGNCKKNESKWKMRRGGRRI
ncbi:uncharacterized protein LOC120707292 [Panicum virgatum]|uniref:uncharacterized protein LOC120707292 n=1 Tax=Panicum virgatum TaxID=38727 RepID=UPI0019D502B5|nr:uncharacterized protein LOC120707292 [Panicum virgatum]